MKKILVLGAGRSSSALITYLLEHSSLNEWHITVGDALERAAAMQIGSSSHASALQFNVENEAVSRDAIARADVVISMLPAIFHPRVARLCLQETKHLLTASYISDEMNELHDGAKAKSLLFLNECGLDPGIDHMSAMQVINQIRSEGGKVVSFESFTGGLIAPETDPENPWRYKFTWNPRNVVLAGQGTAKFLKAGKYQYIPYQQLFKRITPVYVSGHGDYEGYANRDSLKYVKVYGLQECQTVLRGTLREKDYCTSWNVFVQLGCCDDGYLMENVDTMTHRDFIASFLDSSDDLEATLCSRLNLSNEGAEMERLRWSGMFEKEKVGLNTGTPAQILEHILNKKWKLAPGDKDFIVMWHRFKYIRDNSEHEIQAWLTVTGENASRTAMAKTVGLPLAIACKLLLQGKIKERGVAIPLAEEIYRPVLNELNELGIRLEERHE